MISQAVLSTLFLFSVYNGSSSIINRTWSTIDNVGQNAFQYTPQDHDYVIRSSSNVITTQSTTTTLDQYLQFKYTFNDDSYFPLVEYQISSSVSVVNSNWNLHIVYFARASENIVSNATQYFNTNATSLENLQVNFVSFINLDTYAYAISLCSPLSVYSYQQNYNDYTLTISGGSPSRNFSINTYVYVSIINTSYEGIVDSAYQSGFTAGQSSGYDSGYDVGYFQGYNDGLGQEGFTFSNYLFSIADTPVIFIRSLFGYELFGESLFAVLLSLITLVIVLGLIRRFI